MVGWLVPLVLAASPVRADAIDGQWCLAANNSEIDGPTIRTSSGNRIVGNYDRHGFAYVVPANEQGAGTQIVRLLDEETVHLTARRRPAGKTGDAVSR